MSGLFLPFDMFVALKALPVLLLLTLAIMNIPSSVFSGLSVMLSSFRSSMTPAYSGAVGSSPSGKVTAFFIFVMFLSILTFNLMSLTPFVPCPTAIPALSMSLSLLSWLSVTSLATWFSLSSWLAHLTPSGCPSGLAPLLVLIELTSIVIRVITLGVRLFANLTSGHIILGLTASLKSYTASALPLFLLTVLEVLVACIQAYVFSLLTYLYLLESEVSH